MIIYNATISNKLTETKKNSQKYTTQISNREEIYEIKCTNERKKINTLIYYHSHDLVIIIRLRNYKCVKL